MARRRKGIPGFTLSGKPQDNHPNSTTYSSITTQGAQQMVQQNTGAWMTFTYVSFAVSVGMMALGIWLMPADLWVKGYLLMGSVFMIGSCFSLAKTVRDEHEVKRFTNRIEEAKTEKLLMGIDGGAA